MKFGANYFESVVDEASPVFHAGDNYTFDAGKGCCAPLDSVNTAIVAFRRQAADVSFEGVVICWHSRVIEERKELTTMFEQALPDSQAFGMLAPTIQVQFVEPIVDALTGFVKGNGHGCRPCLTQFDRILHLWSGYAKTLL
jgi:hypothetical protein